MVKRWKHITTEWAEFSMRKAPHPVYPETEGDWRLVAATVYLYRDSQDNECAAYQWFWEAPT